MTSPSTYTARCWRDGDAWLVHVVELDAKVRAARLSQVETAARDVVARFGGDNATSARIVVDLQVQDDLMHLLNAAASARAERDRVSVEAVTLRRGLARQLLAQGLALREVSALLGLSVVRTQQLLGESSHALGRKLARSVPASSGSSLAVGEGPARPKAHGAYQHEAFL